MADTKQEPKPERKPGEILLDDMVIKDLASVVGELSKGGSGSGAAGAAGCKLGGQNIVTVEMPREQAVASFEPGRLHDQKGIRYSDVMRSAPAERAQGHGARFRLSELTRGPLSVEAEEEERIEAEVQRRLAQRVEELRSQVTADAYREGYEAGKEQGRTEIAEAAAPKLKQLEALVGGFESLKSELFKANEEFLIHLVYQLAQNVILRELKEDADYTKRLALHLLDRLGTRENIKIFISEAELSSAEALKAGLAQTLGQLKNISVEGDPSITKGGCRIETDFGEVDARIEVQIQSIAQGLGTDQQKP